ncbi:MAG: VCBS repeat-containing protein, partial [Planctomycetota bacterium]
MLARATLALTVAGTAPVAAQQFPLPDRWHQALSSPTQTFAELRIEHLDGDGRLDVLARSVPALGTPAWYATRSGASASGEFTAPALVGSGHPVGDLNGDGRTDFARVLATTVTPPLSTTFAVQLSNGAGDWLALAPQTIEWSVYSSILAKLAGADVDNDGRGDLVVYGQLLPHVYTVLGDGAGGLSNMIGHPYGAQTAVDLAAADLEGDGDTDLVLCTAAPDTVSVLRSVGPAWFLAPSVEHATSSSPTDLVLADFDVDGDVDAVFQCAPNNLLRYLAGDGAGGFAPSVDLAVPSGVLSDAIASDADDDGAPDLVVSTYVELGIFRGTPGAAPA